MVDTGNFYNNKGFRFLYEKNINQINETLAVIAMNSRIANNFAEYTQAVYDGRGVSELELF